VSSCSSRGDATDVLAGLAAERGPGSVDFVFVEISLLPMADGITLVRKV
jgi:hypothetical protein